MTVRALKSLEERGARVVGVERLDRAGPRHAGDVAEQHEDEAERGQQQILDLGEEAGVPRRLGRHGQDVEPEAEDHDHEHGPDELRDGGRGQTAHRDHAVTKAPLFQRRGDATQDPDRHDDHEREQRELRRVLERRPEQVADGSPERVGVAEIALEHAADPVAVLDEDRPVRTELLVELVDGLLVGEGAEDRAADVAGEQLGGDEDDHAQQDERDECEPESSEEEPCHGRSATRRPEPAPPVSASPVSGREARLRQVDVAHSGRQDPADVGCRRPRGGSRSTGRSRASRRGGAPRSPWPQPSASRCRARRRSRRSPGPASRS